MTSWQRSRERRFRGGGTSGWTTRAVWSWLATGWFWYLGTLVPVIGLVQVGAQAMADRYTYIPSIGLFIAVVWGIEALLALIPVTRSRRGEFE